MQLRLAFIPVHTARFPELPHSYSKRSDAPLCLFDHPSLGYQCPEGINIEVFIQV